MPPWRCDEVAILKALARRRKSMQEAANALGRTRSAIAGKADRLGISFDCETDPRDRAHRAKLAAHRRAQAGART